MIKRNSAKSACTNYSPIKIDQNTSGCKPLPFPRMHHHAWPTRKWLSRMLRNYIGTKLKAFSNLFSPVSFANISCMLPARGRALAEPEDYLKTTFSDGSCGRRRSSSSQDYCRTTRTYAQTTKENEDYYLRRSFWPIVLPKNLLTFTFVWRLALGKMHHFECPGRLPQAASSTSMHTIVRAG